MKELIPRKWTDKGGNQSLLFFTQLIDELLFPYTIDSFKLPANNINTLIAEAIKTIEHINEGVLKDGCLQSIKDEIVDTLSKDVSAREIISEDIEILFNSFEKNGHEKSLNILKYLQIKLKDDYYEKLKEFVRKKLEEDDYDDLVRATKYLLVEIVNIGYSIEYINLCNKKIFIESKVEGIGSFDVFVDCFDKEEENYTIIFEASENFAKFKKFFNGDVVKLGDRPNIPGIIRLNRKVKDFVGGDAYYLQLIVSTKDCFKAFYKARYITENIVSNITYLQHQGDYWISNSGVILEEDKATFYSGHKNPIFRRPDTLKDERLKTKFETVVSSIISNNVDYNSRQRLVLAYHRHLSSIRSLKYENQLIDLWSGVEILIPVERKYSQDKISQIASAVCSIITENYIKKILKYLFDAVKNSTVKKEIFKILKSIDRNYSIALAKCIMDSSHFDKYELIVNILETYPLLLKRISYYHKSLSNTDGILLLIKNHQKRVGWQIQRIYRARNLIIHSGKTPYQLETLIENLHFYFDLLLNEINRSIYKCQKETSLEHIHLCYNFRNQRLMKFLKKNKNKIVDEEIFNSLVVGSIPVS